MSPMLLHFVGARDRGIAGFAIWQQKVNLFLVSLSRIVLADFNLSAHPIHRVNQVANAQFSFPLRRA